jgi:hypothetical protein
MRLEVTGQDEPEAGREQDVAILAALCVGEIYVAMVTQLPAVRASS